MARGDGRIYQRGNVFWVCYYLRGEKFREPARTKDRKSITDPRDAEKFLRARLKEVHADEVGARTFETPQMRRLTIHDLLESLKVKYQNNGQDSPQNLSNLRKADAEFGHLRALDVKSKTFRDYRTQQLSEADAPAPATINRVLQMVRAAFRLAMRRAELSRGPFIEIPSEKGNERKGFYCEKQISDLLAALPDDGLRDFIEWDSLTGQRTGEVKLLTWTMVSGNELHIPGEVCKNGRPRVLPLGPELAAILARREKARRIEEKGTVRMAQFIFHRGDGHPINEFRKTWQSACVQAGLGKMVCETCEREGAEKVCPACKRPCKYIGRIPHDFRRTVARRLLAAGVSQQVSKQITGHKTDSMFERYAIVDAADLLAAQEKVAAFRKAVSN